ncbi:unnamed protein product [Polarella glacialis]|uniref:Uncharacterized protein n=1 Tax=Polarella glacialis TaxID=89957 RepID=A0A813E6E4_POLGL|nr:unnamed protein product [Polarella glacialis]
MYSSILNRALYCCCSSSTPMARWGFSSAMLAVAVTAQGVTRVMDDAAPGSRDHESELMAQDAKVLAVTYISLSVICVVTLFVRAMAAKLCSLPLTRIHVCPA